MSRLSARRSILFEPRVEDVAEAVAEEVEGDHEHGDRDAGNRHQPGIDEHVVASFADHLTEAGIRRLYAHADEREAGFEDDRQGDVVRAEDECRRYGVRQDMAPDDAQVVDAERARGLHALSLP